MSFSVLPITPPIRTAALFLTSNDEPPSEFAEFLTLPTYEGMLNKLSKKTKELVLTNINRAIDTILMPI